VDNLVGNRYNLYGVWDDHIKLNDTVYRIDVDPFDGYRSYLNGVTAVLQTPEMVFSTLPIAEIVVHEDRTECKNGYILKDDLGHVWLELGTDHHDSWYPYVYMRYNPKEPDNV